MSQNPFEAPRVELEIDAMPAAGKFDVRRAIADAWRAVIGDLGVVIIASVIFFSAAMASIVTVLGFFLFLPVLVYGGFKMLINLQDGIAGYTDLGDGFPRYWSTLGDALLMMFLQTLLYVPWWVLAGAGAMVDNRPLATASHLAGLAVAAALLPRFVFAPFYMVERGLDAFEAMKISWAVTADQKLMTLILVIASMAIASLGAACGITAVISVPMGWVMFASAFRQMNPRPARES